MWLDLVGAGMGLESRPPLARLRFPECPAGGPLALQQQQGCILVGRALL